MRGFFSKQCSTKKMRDRIKGAAILRKQSYLNEEFNKMEMCALKKCFRVIPIQKISYNKSILLEKIFVGHKQAISFHEHNNQLGYC